MSRSLLGGREHQIGYVFFRWIWHAWPWDIWDLLDRVCRPCWWFLFDKQNLFSTVECLWIQRNHWSAKCSPLNASRRWQNVTSWLQVPDTTFSPISNRDFFRIPQIYLQYLLSYILKFLICIHAGNPRVPPRVLAHTYKHLEKSKKHLKNIYNHPQTIEYHLKQAINDQRQARSQYVT